MSKGTNIGLFIVIFVWLGLLTAGIFHLQSVDKAIILTGGHSEYQQYKINKSQEKFNKAMAALILKIADAIIKENEPKVDEFIDPSKTF